MSHTAFVTGATGFVGINLVHELARQGWETTVLARPTSSLVDIQSLPIRIKQGDITNVYMLEKAIPKNVDCVFHVAASTNVWSKNNAQQRLVNVEGTRNVMEAAITQDARRMIHTSSFVVWGFQPEIFDEQSTRLTNAQWINYVRTKTEAEQVIRDAVLGSRIDAVILNPGHILGPYDRHNWSRMIRMVDQGNLPGVPPGGGVFADVREIAKAQIAAFHQGHRGQNYLLGGVAADYLDLVKIVGELLNRKVPEKPTPAWLLRSVGRVKAMIARYTDREPDITPESAAMITNHMHCDSSKAIEKLGYSETPIRELLEETCRWMKTAGLLQG